MRYSGRGFHTEQALFTHPRHRIHHGAQPSWAQRTETYAFPGEGAGSSAPWGSPAPRSAVPTRDCALLPSRALLTPVDVAQKCQRARWEVAVQQHTPGRGSREPRPAPCPPNTRGFIRVQHPGRRRPAPRGPAGPAPFPRAAGAGPPSGRRTRLRLTQLVLARARRQLYDQQLLAVEAAADAVGPGDLGTAGGRPPQHTHHLGVGVVGEVDEGRGQARGVRRVLGVQASWGRGGGGVSLGRLGGLPTYVRSACRHLLPPPRTARGPDRCSTLTPRPPAHSGQLVMT